MTEKIIKLDDKISQEDQMILNMIDFSSPKGTEVIIRNKETGEELFKGHNKTIIAGSQFIATKLWGIDNAVTLPTYNGELGIEDQTRSGSDNEPLICLFCVGISGCGSQSSQVYPVSYTNRIPGSSLVPFRYEKGTDLPDDLRSLYYGRKYFQKEQTQDDRYAYYFKAIESKQLHLQYVDGTEVTSTCYSDTSGVKAITFVEAALSVSKSDCRDIFSSGDFTPTLGDGTISPPLTLADARINTLSLCQGWYKTSASDGIKYFFQIQPVTQINFSNIALVDASIAIEVLYRTYY